MTKPIDFEEYGDALEEQLVNVVENLDLDLITVVDAFQKVHKFFSEKGEDEKAWLWFKTKNPMFGNVSPIRMCMLGKESNLLKFIENAEELRGCVTFVPAA